MEPVYVSTEAHTIKVNDSIVVYNRKNPFGDHEVSRVTGVAKHGATVYIETTGKAFSIRESDKVERATNAG